jgi:hypothetical protein
MTHFLVLQPIIQFTAHGGENQKFRFEPVGEEGWGVLRIKSSRKFLTVFGTFSDSCAPIVQHA